MNKKEIKAQRFIIANRERIESFERSMQVQAIINQVYISMNQEIAREFGKSDDESRVAIMQLVFRRYFKNWVA